MELLSPVPVKVSLYELKAQLLTFRKLYRQLDSIETPHTQINALCMDMKESMRYGIMFWEGDIANYNRIGVRLESASHGEIWAMRRKLVALLVQLCELEDSVLYQDFEIFLSTATHVQEIVEFLENRYVRLCSMLSAYYKNQVQSV